MLRNSERQTGHQVVKKNRNTGRPWLDSWAVDRLAPSANVNSKWGTVLPTPVPTSGWSTITAALAGASVGADAGSGRAVDRGANVGTAAESGRAVDVGASVGLERALDGDAVLELRPVAASEAGADVAGTSVAEAPQAKIPIIIAVNGKASSRDIPQSFLPVQLDGLQHPDNLQPHCDPTDLQLSLHSCTVRAFIRKPVRPRISSRC